MPITRYRLHAGARMALNVTAVLCMITIVGIPFGAWLLWRVSTGEVVLDDQGLSARALGSTRVAFADVARFGILRVPIYARGIGGALARRKVGGNEGVNLCFQTRAGKLRKLTVSMYERSDEILAEVVRRLERQPEPMKMGLWGPVWQKAA